MGRRGSIPREVRGFVDLHCHWIAAVDDGVKTLDDGIELLRGLRRVGFDIVVATPHMRPSMFDNDRHLLEQAFASTRARLVDQDGLPAVFLGSEHFLDDVVFNRLIQGEGLPYPDLSNEPGTVADEPRPLIGSGASLPPARGSAKKAKRSVLVELHPQGFPPQLHHRLFDLGRAGLRPVLAHPERYHPVWKDDTCLDPLLDAGALLLLDVCALVGKYGRASQRAAEKLLDEDAYEAACSDAHRPDDAATTGKAIEVLEKRVGARETERLLRDGPRGILGL